MLPKVMFLARNSSTAKEFHQRPVQSSMLEAGNWANEYPVNAKRDEIHASSQLFNRATHNAPF
jgi:hypothetical protein